MINKNELIVTVLYNEFDDFAYFANNKKGAFLNFNSDKVIDCYLESCREEFRFSLASNTKKLGFYFKNINIALVNEFFTLIENQLELKIKSIFTAVKIKSKPEYNNYIVCIQPSPFWMQNVFRREFLTLFLRCAVVYYKGDFNKALNSYDLTKKIKPAIFHFLEGNIYPNYSPLFDFGYFEDEEFLGLVETFKNKTKKQMRGYLLDFDISKC